MLNTSLQGRECNVFSAFEQVSSFRRKLDLWATRVEKGCLDMFPTLADFMQEVGPTVVPIQSLVAEHLGLGLCQQFTHYFSNEAIQDEWIRNPFKFNPAERDVLSMQDEEALIGLVIMNWSKWLHTLPLDFSGSLFKMNFLNSHKEHWGNLYHSFQRICANMDFLPWHSSKSYIKHLMTFVCFVWEINRLD